MVRSSRYRSPVDDHNRECFELWLLTRAQKLSTRPPSHPDEHHGRTGKPGPRVNQDDTWLEAISSPDCVSTDRLLSRIIKDLERWEPEAFGLVKAVYLGDRSDPALPEAWRKGIEAQRQRIREIEHPDDQPLPRESFEPAHLYEVKRCLDRIHDLEFLLHYLEDAFVFALYRIARERRAIYWPAPDEAFGYVEGQKRKKRIAIYRFEEAKAEGKTTPEAVRIAVQASGASKRSVYRWASGREVEAPTSPEPGS